MSSDRAVASTSTEDITAEPQVVPEEQDGNTGRIETLDDPATRNEIWSWYLYDFANSPFWQGADILQKWIQKRLAEFAAAKGQFPSQAISAGSYPGVILWLTAAIQVVVLLTFSPYGDFGIYRTKLLIGLTYLCSLALCCNLFCFTSVMWWFAGLVRVAGGICFVLSTVYYNAALPLLTRAHPSLGGLNAEETAQKVEQISNDMSAKGMAWGYIGGFLSQILILVVVMFTECKLDEECSEFNQVFWLACCVALVGLWYASFSTVSFRFLKPRPGPPFPAGVNPWCFGWKQTCHALRILCGLRQQALFCLAYFIWSDALNTIFNVATLVVDDGTETTDSSKILTTMLATFGILAGIPIFLGIQKCFHISSKVMLLVQLVLYVFLSVLAYVTQLKGIAFYLVLGPCFLMGGSLQALSRSIFANLTPSSMEAQMFALYAITDKGSTLLGAMVIIGVHTSTGEYLAAFWYCAVAFLVSGLILLQVDVKQGASQAKAAVAQDTQDDQKR